MAEVSRRTQLGPTMKIQTTEERMARIAQKDMYIEDAEGIRRKIVAGSPLPPAIDIPDAEAEEVPTRNLAQVVVDEEASLSHADRTKAARTAARRSAPREG
jgi:hypothetical protein